MSYSAPTTWFGRFSLLLVALVALIALLGGWPRSVRADGCKPDGQRCATNISCCSGNCMKPRPPPGKAKPLFGVCGTPTSTTTTTTTTSTTTSTACTPDCAGRNCGDDGCGGSCGTCAMSDCDTTTGMCVGCIPDGDQGCRSGFDCCSGVCGAGTICETTTTTTTTTTSTTLPSCTTNHATFYCICGDGSFCTLGG